MLTHKPCTGNPNSDRSWLARADLKALIMLFYCRLLCAIVFYKKIKRRRRQGENVHGVVQD